VSALLLPDLATLTDLRTFVGRARQVDDGGAIRLVGHGPAVAMYAAALHGGGGPTVLALRVLALAEAADLDATVSLSAMADRFARLDRLMAGSRPSPRSLGRPIEMPVPPTPATNAGWAGVLPARTGWSAEGTITLSGLRAVARAGIDEVASGTPAGAGAAAVQRLRARIWGRPIEGSAVPSGAAFAAQMFGFLGPAAGGSSQAEADIATLHRCGPWWRLSTMRGHVLARSAGLLG